MRFIGQNSVNLKQILIGGVVLVFGALVYLIARHPESTYFVQQSNINLGLYNAVPDFFGPIHRSLPAFSHVFAFILLTSGFTTCGKMGSLIVCLSWFLIDLAFELGQKFYAWVPIVIPEWFEGIPILENTRDYFILGTFDIFDVAAIAVGALSAYVVTWHTMERRQPG
jgi:hypothetical protein